MYVGELVLGVFSVLVYGEMMWVYVGGGVWFDGECVCVVLIVLMV